MTVELQFKIQNNPVLQRFLRENSEWYKTLNRNPNSFKQFVNAMKDKYQLKTTDRLNKMLNNISMVQMFLDVLK